MLVVVLAVIDLILFLPFALPLVTDSSELPLAEGRHGVFDRRRCADGGSAGGRRRSARSRSQQRPAPKEEATEAASKIDSKVALLLLISMRMGYFCSYRAKEIEADLARSKIADGYVGASPVKNA